MNADDLEACAAELDTCGQELCATIAKMSAVIKTKMPQAWEGKSVAAYGDQFDQLKPGFDRGVEICGEICAQARQVCQNFRDADDGMAGSMGVI